MTARWPEDQEAVRSGVRRCFVTKVDDSGKQQLCDLSALKGEELKGVVRILPHGFASNPPNNSEGIIVGLGQRSDRAMVVGLEDPQTRQRNLPTGTAVLYDDKGNIVFMKGDKGIVTAVAKGDYALTVTKGDYSITTTEGNISITSQKDGKTIVISAKGDITINCGKTGTVYLGPGPYSNVLTVAGASSDVVATISA